MKKLNVFLLLFLPVFCVSLRAQQPDTIPVAVSDLQRLQDLLRNTMRQNENVIQRSAELQRIINASEQELNGLNVNLTQLRNELRDWRNISEAQGLEINRLLPLLAEQDRISKRQAELLGATLAGSKRLKITLCIGIPAAAGLGVLAGMLLSK